MINLSKLPKSVRALKAEVIFPPAAMTGGKDDPAAFAGIVHV